MNIYTQICGLTIVLLLLYFYKKHPTMGLDTERKFIHILYAVICCIVLDITSVFLIYYSNLFKYETVTLICKLYLVSIYIVTYLTLSYAFADVNSRLPKGKPRSYQVVSRSISAIVIILILMHPIDFVNRNGAIYTTGSACYVTYISCFFVIGTTLISSYRYKRYIKPKRRQALQLWMYLWLFFAFIQFFFPQILIIGFGSCVGTMITFFELENPETNISKRSGLFSGTSLLDYFDYLFKQNSPFSILMFTFVTSADSSIDTKSIKTVVECFNSLLYDYREGKVFTTTEGYFIIVFDSPYKMIAGRKFIDENIAQFREELQINNLESLLHPYYIYVPNARIASNSNELLNLLVDFTPSDIRNCLASDVTIDENAIKALNRKKEIEDMVVDALANDRVEVFYQPIYSTQSGIFNSAEALVRIRLQDGTLITPDTFIPIAEDTGRIIALSDAIFNKTFSFMKSYRLAGLGIEYLELNLSIRQGEDSKFPQRFIDALQRYNLTGSMINLEITETASLQKKDMLLNTMNKLKECGCHFSLDDFGSGSSNLNYIIDMPVDLIKFDRELTSSYFQNEKARAVVSVVTSLAHSLNMKIVAEGIETESQYRIMSDIGIDFIQGYYFSKPLPEKEFIRFLQQNNLKSDTSI